VPDLFANVSKGRPVRFVIDPETLAVERRVLPGYDRSPDFPAVRSTDASTPYDDFWCLGISASGKPGRKFFDELIRLRWSGAPPEVYTLPRGEYFGGEPSCIAGPQAGQTVVLLQRFRPESGEISFVMFDGDAVQAGPIAELPLKSKICPGFHSSFQPA
jgi:carotenoid cleavage dioxygenase-like enzyme